jgi:hypothetical protein
LAENGSLTDIINAVRLIEKGRLKQFTDGQAEEGLQEFKEGSAILKQVFLDAQATGNIETILNAEYDFLGSELSMGDPEEVHARASAEAALEKLDDAFLAYEAVQDSAAYKNTDKAFPHHGKPYRYKSLPKDGFHVFCESHNARLQNGHTRYGVSSIDRDLINLRIDTLAALEETYCVLQRKALTI